MRMSRTSVVLFILVIAACNGDSLVSETSVSASDTARSDASGEASLSVERARQLLENRSAPAVGPIALNGYNFHREVEIGGGVRVIAISRNLAGGLLVFAANGANIATKDTKEITWLQLFDFDEDGVAEIVTEEIHGRGTGVLEKSFHLYRVAGSQIVSLWQGESYTRHAPTPDLIREREGFIRFDRSGSGTNARLIHVVVAPDKTLQRSVFEWRGDALELASEAQSSMATTTGVTPTMP